MASPSSMKLLFLLALLATSCMAQAPSGAPTVSPAATPTPVPVAPPTPSPSSEAPTSGEPSPAPAPGAASPNAPSPVVEQPPADGSNDGFVSRAAVGGTALTAAIVAMALM